MNQQTFPFADELPDGSKPIPGYPGYYIFPTGEVSSPLREKLKLLKNRDGYLQVSLCIEGKFASRPTVHKLVAEAFIGPRPDGYDIDHINRIRDDNRVENLRYLPVAENRSQGGPPIGNKYGAKISAGIVRAIREQYRKGGKSQEAIGEKFGISQKAVSSIVRRESWKDV